MRTIRVCRDKNNWLGKIEKHIPTISVAGERLTAFMIVLFVFCHVSACLWYFMAQFEGICPNSWILRYGFQDSSNYEVNYNSYLYYITYIYIYIDLHS